MTAIASPKRRARTLPASAYPGDPKFYRGDDFQVDESIGYLLRTLRIQMDRAIDVEMAPYDLTGVQWRPLLAIHFGLGDTAAELARVGCVDTGAMTRMLDRLEAKGLLRRSPCPADARIMRITLTAEGSTALPPDPLRTFAGAEFAVARIHRHGARDDEVDGPPDARQCGSEVSAR